MPSSSMDLRLSVSTFWLMSSRSFFNSLNLHGLERRFRMINNFHLLPINWTVVTTGQLKGMRIFCGRETIWRYCFWSLELDITLPALSSIPSGRWQPEIRSPCMPVWIMMRHLHQMRSESGLSVSVGILERFYFSFKGNPLSCRRRMICVLVYRS